MSEICPVLFEARKYFYFSTYEPTEFICDRYQPNDEMHGEEWLEANREWKQCLIRVLEDIDD